MKIGHDGIEQVKLLDSALTEGIFGGGCVVGLRAKATLAVVVIEGVVIVADERLQAGWGIGRKYL